MKETVVICNIGDQTWHRSLPYGTHEVKPCPPGQDYALTEISNGRQMKDLGGKLEPVELHAEDIARDVVMELEDHGVFVCAGDSPTAKELATAKARMEAFFRREIEIADAEWNRNPEHRNISDVARRGANHFGFERPWAGLVEMLQACEYCGAQVRTGVAKCRECGGILDAEKALRGGLITREQYAEITAQPEAEEVAVGASSRSRKGKR